MFHYGDASRNEYSKMESIPRHHLHPPWSFCKLTFCLSFPCVSINSNFLNHMFSGQETQLFINQAMKGSMWAFGGAVYIGGALIYVFRLPERFYPKRFDLCGSSHNIFHIAVVAGCAIHFNESMNLYLNRKETVCPIQIPK